MYVSFIPQAMRPLSFECPSLGRERWSLSSLSAKDGGAEPEALHLNNELYRKRFSFRRICGVNLALLLHLSVC
jgi:hypothetical protein